MTTQFARADAVQEKALLGRWYSESSTPSAPDDNIVSGAMKLAAVDEYLGNGAVNSQGQITLSFRYKDGTTLEAAWLVTAASEWQIKDGSLFEKLVDIRAIPDYVKANGEFADSDELKEFFGQTDFKIEDLMPKGQSTEDIIISIDDSKFIYRSKDDDGVLVEYTKYRTQKNFSGYKK
jgi:hypothetical protein